MNYFDMNCFVILAKLKNYSKASDFLFISQPALTKKIQNIEKELGVKLIDRKGIKIELNNNGRLFFEYCTDALDKYKTFNKKLENTAKDDFSQINIVQLCNIFHFEDFLLDFYKRFCNIQIKIFQHNQDRLGLYDWDVRIFASSKKETEDVRLLYQEDIVLVMSKECSLAKKDDIALKDLHDFNLLLMPDTTWINSHLSSIFEKNNFMPHSNFYCDNYGIIERMCEYNFGISFSPEKSFEYKDNSNLTIRHVRDVDIKRYVYIKNNKNIFESRATNDFINSIIKHYKDKL